jgi:hypothetical protein
MRLHYWPKTKSFSIWVIGFILKGVWNEICYFRFISGNSVPRACHWVRGFIAGVIDTGNKLFSVHRCQWHRWLILVTNFQWLLVLLIPAINLSLVSLTLVKNLRQVFDQGVSGVYGCSFSWRFNETVSGHVPLRQQEISLFWFEIVLGASVASGQNMSDVVYGCAFSLRFQCHHWRSCPTPSAGNIAVFYRCRQFAILQKEQTLSQQFIAGVNDTGIPFFPGVVDMCLLL